MRTVQTFMLRLLVDPAEPGMLRGALHCVPGSSTLPFSDETGLLELLQRLAFGQGCENGVHCDAEHSEQPDFPHL